jgi:hypothetical protein
MNPQNQLLWQIARKRDGSLPPLTIQPKARVEPGQWTMVEMTLSPPDQAGHRVAAMRLNDRETATATLPRDLLRPMDLPLGLGVEFLPFARQPIAWPNFPGKIRLLEIRPFASAPSQ